MPHYLKLDFKPERISEITNGFSEQNYIGKFQFGKVYRGIYYKQEVTVKIWEDNPDFYKALPGDNESRVKDEVELHECFTEDPWLSHPNVAKLIGSCQYTGNLATVYELKPLDTVHNLLPKDGFTWPQRIKVALGISSVLEFMHAWNLPSSPCLPYLIRNVDAAHIMLDLDYNPFLFDFSMISGGILFDRRNLLNQYLDGCYGYADPVCARQGEWSDKCDVFSYGVLLLGLISKRVHVKEDDISHASFLYEWAKSEYIRQKSTMGIHKSKASLVHQSLESGPHFYSIDGIKITKLAMRCVSYDPRKRPTMQQVVKYLHNLHVVRCHAAVLGIDQMLHAGATDSQTDDYLAGYRKIMLKKSDFQILLWYLKHKEKFPRQCKLLLEWWWQYFSESIHRGSQLFKCHRSPSFGLAGKGSSVQECNLLKVFSYEDLSLFTKGFSNENFIDNFQFGRVFHGKIEGRQVTVKIWEFPKRYKVKPGHNGSRLRDEIVLLQYPKQISHPNLVTLVGYCHDGEQLGVVYDLKPLDTVYNLIQQDSFTWLWRIKVAFRFACLLKFLHAGDARHLPYLVRNISASHIMLDQDFNPKLYDFGMISGGILPDRSCAKHQCVFGCIGYLDDYYRMGGGWSVKSDVYAYGVVLLSLISKRKYTEDDIENNMPDVFQWAKNEYEAKIANTGSPKSKCSLVHQSLEQENGFYFSDGFEVTKLAMECVAYKPWDRPTMTQVIKRLQKLLAVRRHGDYLGIKQMLG